MKGEFKLEFKHTAEHSGPDSHQFIGTGRWWFRVDDGEWRPLDRDIGRRFDGTAERVAELLTDSRWAKEEE